MSNKATCPACDSTTSSVYAAFSQGEACPYCGLAAGTAAELEAARARGADELLVARCAEAELRAQSAEADADRVRRLLAKIRHAVAESGLVHVFVPGGDDSKYGAAGTWCSVTLDDGQQCGKPRRAAEHEELRRGW